MRLNPTLDYVAVFPDAPKEKSQGGILLPGAAGETSGRGQVIAVGPGRYAGGTFVKVQLNVGDRVIFNEEMSREVEIDGKKYQLMRHEAVIATIEA